MEEKKAPRIIVDNRERNMEILEGLAGSGIMLEFAQLPVGDYIISKRMCVERKTVQDFESSIMNSRVFDQLDRLSHEFGKPILILEGDEADFTMQRNAILGAIISIYRDYNVQVMRSEGTWDTVTMLARLAEKEQEDRSREPKIVGSKRAYTDSQWQVLILGALPGIGPKLAVSLRITQSFLTIPIIATERELYRVSGWTCPPTTGTPNFLTPSARPSMNSLQASGVFEEATSTIASGFPPIAAISFMFTTTAP